MQVEELFAKLGLEVDHTAFAKAESLLEGLNLKFLAIGGAVAATIGVMVHVTKEVRDAGFEASKAAQRTGLTVEAWQELKAAGAASGISAETLEHSLILMSKAAYGAAEGGTEMQIAYRKLGVHTKDTNGKLKSGDQLLMDLADGFQRMPDGIEKTALATKAFGRSGAEMLPFLNKGSEGLAELREHAHALGLVLDEETIAAAKEWKQSMIEFGEVVEGLKYKVGSALLKAFVKLKKAAADLFATLINGSMGLKKHWAAFAPLIAGLAGLLLYKLAASLVLNSGLMTVLTALTTEWGRASLIAGGRAALAPVIAAAPWVLLAAVIGLVTEDIYNALTGGRSVFAEWTKFLKSDPGDSPFAQELKRELRMLTDIQGTITQIIKLKDGLFAGFASAFQQGMKGNFREAAMTAVYNTGVALDTVNTLDNNGLNQRFPFLTPSAGTTAGPSVSNTRSSKSNTLSIGTLSITAATSDPKDLASQFEKHVQNFWQQQTSTAHGGVD